MRLEDALFNWLQIKTVADARPDDRAAQETTDFFYEILVEDHQLVDIGVSLIGEDLFQIAYVKDGQHHKQTFDREMTEQLLLDINENPKYNE
jgi:hypothetical protein